MNVKSALLVVAVTTQLAGCASLESALGKSKDKTPDSFPKPVFLVKPEIDYSGEYPNCVVAGQRLADNVEVGMTLKDVTRLVGQPRWKIPGSWWWSKSFSKAGKPLVRFGIQKGQDDTVITGLDTSTDRCEPSES